MEKKEKKYIVELSDENVKSADGYDWLQLLISVAYEPVMVETAIQLLPYTEPRKESCDKCMNEAEDLAYQLYSSKVDEAYQRGLENAWEVAKKICMSVNDGGLSSGDVCKIFNVDYYRDAMKNFSPLKAIEKIKAYEQKKEEQITIGDEVVFYNGERCVVTVAEDGQAIEVMDENGLSMKMDDGLRNSMKKTGRHFEELVTILKKMKGE